jgi:hypothetical protein
MGVHSRAPDANRLMTFFHNQPTQESHMGRSILLWLLGVPIPIIILLALFWR